MCKGIALVVLECFDDRWVVVELLLVFDIAVTNETATDDAVALGKNFYLTFSLFE